MNLYIKFLMTKRSLECCSPFTLYFYHSLSLFTPIMGPVPYYDKTNCGCKYYYLRTPHKYLIFSL